MTGGNGSVNGIIDSQSAVGGWPELASLPSPADSDDDGMPDEWEDASNLNKNSPSDAQLTTVDGKYPNVEVYINTLVTSITGNQVKDALVTNSPILRNRKDQIRIFKASPDLLKIELDRIITRIDIVSATGVLLKNQKCQQPRTETDISFLRPGVYIVRVRDADHQYYTSKFIKN
jgi:hypothetical protein